MNVVWKRISKYILKTPSPDTFGGTAPCGADYPISGCKNKDKTKI